MYSAHTIYTIYLLNRNRDLCTHVSILNKNYDLKSWFQFKNWNELKIMTLYKKSDTI